MDEIILLVKTGVGELPKINKAIYTESPLTGTIYEIVPKKIKELKWNSNGDLLVTLNAVKSIAEGERT